MTRRTCRTFPGILLAILLLTVSALSSAQTQCSDPSSTLLWEVQGQNSTVYLFGSLHLGDASFYPLPEKIERTFRNADHVVFEVDPHSMATAQAQQRMLQMGSLPPGQTLRDLVSPAVISDLETRLRFMGLPSENFMQFRPWFLTLMLTSLQYTSLGYFPDYGVEQYIAREVPDANRLALETLEAQLGFLQHLDGEAFLGYTLASFEEGRQMAGALVEAWRCADKDALNELLTKGFEAEEMPDIDLEALKNVLIVQRNISMTEKIRTYLQDGEGEYFVVVGSAHYLGEGSIVELLRKQGYEVTAVRL
ncbi:TraB/GumN family protein [Proteobacteria bacterium 005FR1]|nr:TraB/GumN family protein [Proteobacteria bacterium 005FR1]